jgi:hypothetical protein
MATIIAPRILASDVDSSEPLSPQLTYYQYDVANLRTCIVELSHNATLLYIPTILQAVAFFVEPITLAGMRAHELLLREGKGPYDYKRALDVHVRASNSCLCLPEINEIDGARALCIDVDLEYLHSWRGFCQMGPGKVIVVVNSKVNQIFVTSLQNMNEDITASITGIILSYIHIYMYYSSSNKQRNNAFIFYLQSSIF